MKTATFLIVMAALGAWTVRNVMAERWKSDQSMHIRWNVTWFSDQYNRIDKLGNEQGGNMNYHNDNGWRPEK